MSCRLGITLYTIAEGLISNSATSIAVAPDGMVWVGTNGGLSIFDGNEWREKPPTKVRGLP